MTYDAAGDVYNESYSYSLGDTEIGGTSDLLAKTARTGKVPGFKGVWLCSEVTQDDGTNSDYDYTCCRRFLPDIKEQSDDDCRLTADMVATVTKFD